MKALLIPARYDSSRFPGKPTAVIAGIPMIIRTMQRVSQAQGFDYYGVVTDDHRIHKLVEEHGYNCMYLPEPAKTGSDRLARANQILKADYVVNCQGDEPLADPKTFERVLNQLTLEDAWVTAHCQLLPGQLESPDSVKIRVDHHNNVKAFFRESKIQSIDSKYELFKHIGVYGYSASELDFFHQSPQTQAELKLSLEQLRVWPQKPFKSVLCDKPSQSVDTPGDVLKVEQILNLQRDR